MSEIDFKFEGRTYTATVTEKKYANINYYYVVLTAPELISRFSSSYIFGYIETIGLQYVSTHQVATDKELMEIICEALRKFIHSVV